MPLAQFRTKLHMGGAPAPLSTFILPWQSPLLLVFNANLMFTLIEVCYLVNGQMEGNYIYLTRPNVGGHLTECVMIKYLIVAIPYALLCD
jgi:hypothetical protein